MNHLCELALKSVCLFQNMAFTNLVADEQMDAQMDERVDRSRTLRLCLPVGPGRGIK